MSNDWPSPTRPTSSDAMPNGRMSSPTNWSSRPTRYRRPGLMGFSDGADSNFESRRRFRLRLRLLDTGEPWKKAQGRDWRAGSKDPCGQPLRGGVVLRWPGANGIEFRSTAKSRPVERNSFGWAPGPMLCSRRCSPQWSRDPPPPESPRLEAGMSDHSRQDQSFTAPGTAPHFRAWAGSSLISPTSVT